MKPFIICILFSLIHYNIYSQTSNNTISIIPIPNSVVIKEGNFTINNKTFIYFNNKESKEIAELFKEFMLVNYNLDLIVGNKMQNSNCIQFISSIQDNKEAYELLVTEKNIIISGENAGLFYGYQSLIQLLPIAKQTTNLVIPSVEIKDEPRFAYRGMHLDVCRHFFPISFIKKYIDILSSYKLNVFHWHLTDDQGWRLEIKKYPNLTSIGGYRNQTLISNYKTDGDYDNTRYGGYYTQQEAKEIVSYAKKRFVTVIPEIEMPGHALAALAAYPNLGCNENFSYKTAETWGVFEDVFCAGKDETFTFLQNVLDEVIEIFPSTYIHIGGDECPKEKWKICSHCQKRIKDNNLKNEHELQSYFIQRIEKYVNEKGRKIIGWDEILEGGLAPNATVMSWRGDAGGIAAAKLNHDVIMTPASYGLYFDHKQGADKYKEPLSIGGYSTLEKVYHSNPIPNTLEQANYKYIKGVQANVWTEYIETSNKVEFTIFPRIFALAEIAWTKNENKNWKNFSQYRVAKQLAKIDFTTTFYRVPELYGIKDTIIYTDEFVIKNIKPSVEGAKIYYTLDNYEPSALDLEFKNELKITIPPNKERIFKAVVITPNGRKSNYTKVIFINSKK